MYMQISKIGANLFTLQLFQLIFVPNVDDSTNLVQDTTNKKWVDFKFFDK